MNEMDIKLTKEEFKTIADGNTVTKQITVDGYFEKVKIMLESKTEQSLSLERRL